MTKTVRNAQSTAAILIVACMALVLAACSSTVSRESGTAGSSQRTVSKPKYGATVQVQRGDTLYGLAFRNGIDFRDLASWNRIGAPYTIYPGQSLRLYPSAGDRGSSSVAARPAATTQNPGRPAVSTAPAATPPVAPTIARSPVSSGFSWRWPADGAVIGRYSAGDASKQGVDIAGSSGQAVRAGADGVVVYSGGGLVGYGELVIIKHSESWLSAYGHNRKRLVNEGQNVKAGQQIAEMGRSGASRDMLHFEIRYNGKPVDPLQYLPKR
ncbi:MAG: LysM peptidoglycan-binding domain-containing protein [Lysobacteraceae bacterium]|nr:MAG: LysM peptidoglycan-binding domain-containing protein [Xanthomonadaceae bacterium]